MSFEQTYRDKALLSLLHKGHQAVITNIVGLAAMLWATSIWRREQNATLIFIGLLFIASFMHMVATGPFLKTKPLQTKAQLLLIASFLSAAVWGIFAGYILLKFELSWTSFFIILTLVAIATAQVVPFSSHFSYLVGLELVLLGPAILVNLIEVGGLQGLGLSVFLSAYFLVILMLGKANKRFHWKLFQSHLRTETMLDALPCTLAWVDSNSTYLGVNKKQAEFWERDPSEFKGQKLGFTQGNTYLPQFVEKLFKSNEEILSTHVERKNRNYLVTGKTFSNNSEAVVVGLDVTDQQELESQLDFQKKLGEHSAHLINLGEIVSDISQELRDCISTGNSARLERLVEKISYLTQTEAGKNKVELKDLAEGVGDLFLHRLTELEIKYEVIADSKAQTLCPAPVVAQALVNLINNAIDALESHNGERRITVQITESGLQVKDSGPGIPKDIQDQVFDAMFTTKDANRASGVGLSTSRQLIESIGGRLEYRNTDGSCFEVSF